MIKSLNDIVSPVTENIRIVNTSNRGRYPYCYSFLIIGDKNIVLDPGRDFDALKALRKAVEIHEVLISHSHPDHFAGAWIFNDLPILCPAESPKNIHDMNFLANRATGGGVAAKMWIDNMLAIMELKPPVPTGFFRNGDIVASGPRLKLKAILTPGHAADHYVFFEEYSGALFSSDIDCTPFGPWYGYEECSISEFRKSLTLIRSLPVRVLLSSHREPIWENIMEEIDNFEQGIGRQKQKLRDLLGNKNGVSLDELTDLSPFYNTPGTDALYMKIIEGRMIRHLLNEMIEAEEVVAVKERRSGGKDFEIIYRLNP
ncbi:MAG: MBL fold metallo-hydrolase [Spirochaetes bacterium]|jgi:glyoxylase-like metal-dependent hydrolase (beta-lactamase superfamily II)|nr:MBL fold metallo-hydrolase [Spirochaetota bacterium]